MCLNYIDLLYENKDEVNRLERPRRKKRTSDGNWSS